MDIKDVERFDGHAQQAMDLAEKEALRLSHGYIEPEHILLEIIGLRESVAVMVLLNLDVDPEKVWGAVNSAINQLPKLDTRETTLSPLAERMIDISSYEARMLGHSLIGTEHILLGLLKEGESMAAGVLESQGVTYERARAEVERLQGSTDTGEEAEQTRMPQDKSGVVREEQQEATEAVQQQEIVEPETPPLPDNPVAFVHTDGVAKVDALGFKEFAQAFTGLVTSPHTTPPLTMGVYGTWGMGKSTLMDMVLRGLEAENRRQNSSNIIPIWFNAWQYSDEEKLWAGLVQQLLVAVEKRLGFWGKLSFHLKRNWSSQFPNPTLSILSLILFPLGLAALSIMYALGAGYFSAIPGALAFASLPGLSRLGHTVVKGPASRQLVHLVQRKDYSSHLGYFSEISQDIDFIVRRLGDKLKVVIFIDDLDRCPLNKVVDVLEAIKLLLEKRIFITFLGLDSRVISRAIEHRYADMWAEASTGGKGGMEYLEKIIQLPFHLPRPSSGYLVDYVKTLTVSPEPAATPVPEPPGLTERPAGPPVSPKTDTGDTGEPDFPRAPLDTSEKPGTPPAMETPPALLEETAEEVAALSTIIPMAAANPRKIKRLVNVYRFVKLLALLQHNYQGNQVFPAPMVKWLTLSECWPSFARFIVTRWREKTALTTGDTEFLNSYVPAYMEEQKLAAIPEQLKVFLQTGPPITSSLLDDLIPLSINFTPPE